MITCEINEEVGLTENTYYFDANGRLDNEPTDGKCIKIVTNVRDSETGKVLVKWWNTLDGTPPFRCKFKEYNVDGSIVTPEYYTITWDKNDGSGEQVIVKNASSEDMYSDYLPSPTFKRNGYTFHGWQNESGVDDTYAIIERQIKNDWTFYAKWSDKVSILIFNCNNHTVMYNSNFIVGFEYSFITDTDDIIAFNSYYHDGTDSWKPTSFSSNASYIKQLKKQHWNEKTSYTLDFNSIQTPLPSSGIVTYYFYGDNITTTAPSGVSTWKVTFDANGGFWESNTGEQISQLIVPPWDKFYYYNNNNKGAWFETPAIIPHKVVDGKNVYSDGWYLDKEGTNKVITHSDDPSTSYKPTSDVTLYAHYKH